MVSQNQVLKAHPLLKQSDLESDRPLEIAKRCAVLASEKKGEDIAILNVSKLTSIADSFVLCSAGSERQAQAIARQVIDGMKADRVPVLGVEGLSEGHWVLLDLGDVVFHIFTKETRSYYDLDGLWADALQLEFPEGKKPPRKTLLEYVS